MTTIAYRNGVLAADSRTTLETEGGGARMFLCEKLFRKTVPIHGECIIATAGESTPGMVFVDWYGKGEPPVDNFIIGEADFTCLVLQKDGLWEFDGWCRGIKIIDEFYAIGSGAKAALGAMHMGASSFKAVEVACKVEHYSGLPIVQMKLKGEPKIKKAKLTKPENVDVPSKV